MYPNVHPLPSWRDGSNLLSVEEPHARRTASVITDRETGLQTTLRDGLLVGDLHGKGTQGPLRRSRSEDFWGPLYLRILPV